MNSLMVISWVNTMWKAYLVDMGVSKNSGTPKMDGENNHWSFVISRPYDMYTVLTAFQNVTKEPSAATG